MGMEASDYDKELWGDKAASYKPKNAPSQRGIFLIAQERARQIEVEGYTPENDARLADGQLAIAAACYALADLPTKVWKRKKLSKGGIAFEDGWPLNPEVDKREKGDRLKNLIKAGALIAAEIDRIKRQEETTKAAAI